MRRFGQRVRRPGWSCAAALLLGSLWLGSGQALAAPDIDGAVDALISTPLQVVGDLAGAAGLITAGVMGGVGDAVALLDENEYARLLLRGIISTTIQHMALTVSGTLTGLMEGARAEDLADYPQAASMYLDEADPSAHLDSVAAGLGTIYLGVTDAVLWVPLVLLRGAGLTDTAKQASDWQAKLRDRYLGKLK